VKALWFEPTLNQTFAAMAEHYDTTILPTRSRKPRDKGKVEGAVLIVERWILARLRHRRFFNLTDLNTAIGGLLEELNDRPMRHIGKSRRRLYAAYFFSTAAVSPSLSVTTATGIFSALASSRKRRKAVPTEITSMPTWMGNRPPWASI
jgi:hypothetical protein